MAVTEFQRVVCRLLADQRIASGESYVAGGVALNELLGAPRRSRDIDLFHDTARAVQDTWSSDRLALEASGFSVTRLRERDTFVEAQVARGSDTVLMQWAQDSAYRFFPLVQHPDLGLTLHPFDLATNKVLALVGRLEPRDWIDVIECDQRLQPLGYLAWAASGKDPGFSPRAILEEAARSNRYSAGEIAALDFDGDPPDVTVWSQRWHALLATAHAVVQSLPVAEVGHCVLDDQQQLFRGAPAQLATAREHGALRFHAGSLRGSLPRIVS